MLDQSFSAENFITIIDYENRKGKDLGSYFFPDVKIITGKIKQLNSDLREARKSLTREDYYKKKKVINEEKNKLRQEKLKLLEELLTKVSETILSKKFATNIIENKQILDKPTYTLPKKSPEAFFAVKQTQYNLQKLYKVKQSNRTSIINQVKNIISDGFPKFIVRTDIQDFYENIPPDNLIKQLNKENLLSFYSKRVISKVLSEYQKISSQKVGIPRGIGISAFLVELYMRDIDHEIKNLPDILYYARYVDDIVVVFSLPTTKATLDYQKLIGDTLQKYGLKIHPVKTQVLELNATPNSRMKLEYLGYLFQMGYDQKGNWLPVKVRISRRKLRKYVSRINIALTSYFNLARVNEKVARKLIVQRLRFITSNTRLVNNKKNVLTGIYYANTLITEPNDLIFLDNYLKRKINISTIPLALKNRLLKFSFERGFKNRSFSIFTTTELSYIMKEWKK